MWRSFQSLLARRLVSNSCHLMNQAPPSAHSQDCLGLLSVARIRFFNCFWIHIHHVEYSWPLSFGCLFGVPISDIVRGSKGGGEGWIFRKFFLAILLRFIRCHFYPPYSLFVALKSNFSIKSVCGIPSDCTAKIMIKGNAILVWPLIL